MPTEFATILKIFLRRQLQKNILTYVENRLYPDHDQFRIEKWLKYSLIRISVPWQSISKWWFITSDGCTNPLRWLCNGSWWAIGLLISVIAILFDGLALLLHPSTVTLDQFRSKTIIFSPYLVFALNWFAEFRVSLPLKNDLFVCLSKGTGESGRSTKLFFT